MLPGSVDDHEKWPRSATLKATQSAAVLDGAGLAHGHCGLLQLLRGMLRRVGHLHEASFRAGRAEWSSSSIPTTPPPASDTSASQRSIVGHGPAPAPGAGPVPA